MSSYQKKLLLLFGCALALRLLYLYQISDSPFYAVSLGDGQAYDAWAERIGHDFWGKEAFFQAPLYPYFLAAIYALSGHVLGHVLVAQALLGSAACVLLALAMRRFFSRRIGLWSGAALALYGPALFFDGIFQKASLDLFLTTALLYWCSRLDAPAERRAAAWAGFTLGLLVLNRENALIWAPCLLGWLVWSAPLAERRAEWRKRVLPFALGLSLVLSTVALRNYAVSGQLVLTTTQFGQNFYIGNNARADGTYQSLRFGHGAAEAERRDAIELAEAATGRKLSGAETSRYWSARAFQFIREEPGAWLALLGKKSLLLWNAREVPDSDEPQVYAEASWLLSAVSHLFCFRTLLPLALGGVVLRMGKPSARLLELLTLALAASTVMFFVVGRYRYPLVPLLIPFAVAAVLRALHAWRHHDRATLTKLLGAVAAGAALVSLDLGPAAHPSATAHYDLAVSLERQARLSDAKLHYEAALGANPEFVEAHVNLGSLLARDGELDRAEQHEQTALRLRPNDALAHATLGNISFERRQLERASHEYEEALRLEPGQPQALDGLAALRDELKERSAHAP